MRAGRSRGNFRDQLAEVVSGDPILEAVFASLIATHQTVCTEATKLDTEIQASARQSALARRLTTVPGVGPIIALSFIATIDHPSRFRWAVDVGAYLGLAPRRYQSGEADWSGRISRRGDSSVRKLLYEAANIRIQRVTRFSPLKAWAMRLGQRKGLKKATVATARKIAGILTRLWRDDSVFAWTKEELPT